MDGQTRLGFFSIPFLSKVTLFSHCCTFARDATQPCDIEIEDDPNI